VKKLGILSKKMSGLTIAGVVFLLLLACSAMQQGSVYPPATVPGAEYVGMENCTFCHAETVKNFKYARHAKLTVSLPDGREVLGCEACHGAGSLHIFLGGGRGQAIINPGENPATCFQCHPEVQAFFSLQYHHPMGEQGLSCNDCHSPHGQNIMLPEGKMVGQHNTPCNKCHQGQSKPMVFEHEALREGCTICHSHHGSINDKLLVANDSNLCLRCHAQIAAPGAVELGGQSHTSRLVQGPCWSAGCHTAVHGSNMNPHLRY
jgi:predicted CXXCH cytochrome family protein